MVTFGRRDDVLREFQSWGWSVKGSLDTILKLESYPIDSTLNAMVKTKNIGDGRYIVVGVLYSGNKILKSYNLVTTQDKIVNDLGLLVGVVMESHFGESNGDPFKSVYEEHRVI